ncbi:MAG: hypothetical protein AAGE59_03585 [Cyanobacteria bacterium P01_F01_bin.86]
MASTLIMNRLLHQLSAQEVLCPEDVFKLAKIVEFPYIRSKT